MPDWVEWHAAYDDPESFLSQRRIAVTKCVVSALEHAPSGRIDLLSLCAGEGRDVIDAATDHSRAADLHGCLVELHPDIAPRARANAEASGLDLTVREADASDPAVFVDRLPVDVLLLAGIFGNISDEDIRATVVAAPAMCRAGATVIWTRGRWEPDITPRIRSWFDEAGCESLAFLSPGPGHWSIGVERVTAAAPADTLPSRLFTFVERADRR